MTFFANYLRWKKINIYIYILVLLTANIERFSVSRMQDLGGGQQTRTHKHTHTYIVTYRLTGPRGRLSENSYGKHIRFYIFKTTEYMLSHNLLTQQLEGLNPAQCSGSWFFMHFAWSLIWISLSSVTRCGHRGQELWLPWGLCPLHFHVYKPNFRHFA